MAQTTYTTFAALSEAAFKIHADSIVGSHNAAAERKQALAYLGQVVQSDKGSIDTDVRSVFDRRLLARKQASYLDQLRALHPFDQTKTPTVFTQQTPTDAQIAAMVTSDDVDITIGTRQLTTNMVFSGDRVSLTGIGATGSAVAGTLACTCKFTGRIELAGDDIRVKGIHFSCPLQSSIITTAACSNITFEDCIFENTSTYTDSSDLQGSAWWYGAGNFLSGNCTIRNCQIGVGTNSYGSWLLADLNTSSSAPVTKLDKVVVDSCRFTNCAGSFAVRGKADDPIDSCEFTNNLVQYGTGSYLQHTLVWASFECNNCVKLTCTDNTATGAVKPVGGDRAFCQAWSRSGHAWTVRFKRNTISNFNIALLFGYILRSQRENRCIRHRFRKRRDILR